jgi:hypothetical protein
MIAGEELPYKLPTGRDADGKPFARVIVTRVGRTFMSMGRPVLMIDDNEPVTGKRIRPAKDHKIGEALVQFRGFLAEYSRQVLKAKPQVEALTAEAKAERAQAERLRQEQRRKAKNDRRAELRMSKGQTT